MTVSDSLLPYGEVTRRLRIRGQRYVGVQPIPVDRIVGSVDRTVDFDRLFRPRRRPLRDRLRALRRVFPDGQIPPITVYEVGGLYFVIDGHHPSRWPVSWRWPMWTPRSRRSASRTACGRMSTCGS